MEPFRHLKAIVFDWAGTMVDHGCLAPAIVFQEIFRGRGIEISSSQAREPMGMAKRAHIAAVAAMPEIAAAWREKYGSDCGEDDIDSMYAEFLPLQKETLAAHCDLIEGAAQIVEDCRRRGLKIGSSTGYTRELMEVVTAAAARQGYQPDCVLCSEDAPRGRPAPYLLYEASIRLDTYPLSDFVKVDDTPVGIEAGRSAGCWTVGITRTGNGVGLSMKELAELAPATVESMCQNAALRLKSAGAHYIVESVADLMSVLEKIERLAAEGARP